MPMPRRRAGLAIVVFFLLRSAIAAPDLPDCAVRCVTISATFNCDIDHYTCICNNFANPVRTCIKDICPGPEGVTQTRQFELQCANEGAPIPGGAGSTTSSPPPQQSTTTPGGSTPPPTSTRSTTTPASTAGPSTHSSSSSTDTTPGNPNPTTSNPANPSAANSSPQQTDTEDKDSGGGASTGSLIGAIVGGLIGGLLVIALAFFILRRRRREYIEDDDDVRAFRVPRADDMSYRSDTFRETKSPLGADESTTSRHQYTNSGSDLVTGNTSPSAQVSPVSRLGGAAVPFTRGAPSVADSQASYAARPLIIENDQPLPPRKGDPPRVPSFRGPGSSVVSESVAGSSSHRGDGDLPIPDSASAYLTSSGAQEQLTPEQLNIVQTMVNRGLPGPAVVDVIQRMLSENQEVPPMYVPPAPGSTAPRGAAAPASATSGSSTRLPYRRGSSNLST